MAAPVAAGAAAVVAVAPAAQRVEPEAASPVSVAAIAFAPPTEPVVDLAVPVAAAPMVEAVVLAPPGAPVEAVPVMDHVLAGAPTEPVTLPAAMIAPTVSVWDKPRVIDPGHSPGVERASSTLAQRIGDDGERLAAIRLEALGWRIVARNLHLSRAEIDLLAIDPSEPPHLVIVEVRRRGRRDFGLAEESVDHRKRAALRRAAGELAIRPVLPDGRRLPNLPVRVDLVAIDRGPDGRPSLRHHRGIEL